MDFQVSQMMYLLANSDYGAKVLEADGYEFEVILIKDDVDIHGEICSGYCIRSTRTNRSRWIRQSNDPDFKPVITRIEPV